MTSLNPYRGVCSCGLLSKHQQINEAAIDALDSVAHHAHWFLRIALASVFLYHGLTKFPGLGMIAEMMQMPVLLIALLAIAETLAGVLILWGGVGPDWATRVAGLIISVDMLGAIILVHFPHGWNSVNMGVGNMGQGMEFPVTLLLISLYFIVVGNRTSAPASDRTVAGRPDVGLA